MLINNKKTLATPLSSPCNRGVKEKLLECFTKAGILHKLTPRDKKFLGIVDEPKVSTEEIFKGVIAYVEARGTLQDVSRIFAAKLTAAGATVCPTFTKKVTHVVFKDGRMSTYKKAVQRSIPVVNILWIVNSLKAERCLPLDEFIEPDPSLEGKVKRHRYTRDTTETPEQMNQRCERMKELIQDMDQCLERIKVHMTPKPSVCSTSSMEIDILRQDVDHGNEQLSNSIVTRCSDPASVSIRTVSENRIEKKFCKRKRLFSPGQLGSTSTPNRRKSKRLLDQEEFKPKNVEDDGYDSDPPPLHVRIGMSPAEINESFTFTPIVFPKLTKEDFEINIDFS